MQNFKLHAPYSPAGDQPTAIDNINKRIIDGKRDTVLLGATGTGKTFTMANIIAEHNRPALVLAHNKTLAAQLYSEMKAFFPDNAVEYFVSYYDYYQPEAYVAARDVYIEKDATINEQIERYRHSATRALLERQDVIVVASVSCIYGLGSPDSYSDMTQKIAIGEQIDITVLARRLIDLQYSRNDVDFGRGTFRIRGDILDIFPSHLEETAWRVEFFGDEIDNIQEIHALTGEKQAKLQDVVIYSNSHYVTPRDIINRSIKHIKEELRERVAHYDNLNQPVELQRINQRTSFDIEMLMETGSCKGIENYSRYLSGREAGDPPPTLMEYLPDNALLFVDESHVTVPQVRGMYNGDRARKMNLVEHGFRLPSALDNRPLKFDEWQSFRPQTIYVSATPNEWELEQAGGEFAQQIIRPTGLIDPICDIRPVSPSATNYGQVQDFIEEAKLIIAKGQRILATTLTKKMAENLTEYLIEEGLKVSYIHSDTDTLERVEILRDLRRGEYDILVGINLLREGLDIPECGLVAILDADKAGFLRSATALIQTIGRAARNAEGRVILYADKMTPALEEAIEETQRRRDIQMAYNKEHNITPQTVSKAIADDLGGDDDGAALASNISDLREQMLDAANDMDFEKAAKLKKKILRLEGKLPTRLQKPS